MPAQDQFTPLSLQKSQLGKSIAPSQFLVTWKFKFKGNVHLIDLIYCSISGQKKLHLNKKVISKFSKSDSVMNVIKQRVTGVPSEPFSHEFDIEDVNFQVKETNEENVFELRCDGQSFDYIFSKINTERIILENAKKINYAGIPIALAGDKEDTDFELLQPQNITISQQTRQMLDEIDQVGGNGKYEIIAVDDDKRKEKVKMHQLTDQEIRDGAFDIEELSDIDSAYANISIREEKEIKYSPDPEDLFDLEKGKESVIEQVQAMRRMSSKFSQKASEHPVTIKAKRASVLIKQKAEESKITHKMKAAYAESGISETSGLAKRSMIEGVEKAKSKTKEKMGKSSAEAKTMLDGIGQKLKDKLQAMKKPEEAKEGDSQRTNVSEKSNSENPYE